MTPSRPYLIRALYQWITDNGMTPYALVDVSRGRDGMMVPEQFIEDGKIVFNLGPSAVRNLELANDAVSFDARFRGVSEQVLVPIPAVMAVYAQENGRGMVFPEEEGGEPPPDNEGPTDGGPGPGPGEGGRPKKPSLRVVK